MIEQTEHAAALGGTQIQGNFLIARYLGWPARK
jgi:hypothetical protein